MPITENGFEYKMPKDMKDKISLEFLKQFRSELFRIHEYYALDCWYDETLGVNSGTSGWATAFGLAAIKTNLDWLYEYMETLPWYDCDIFADEVSYMLVENHLMLDSKEKYIALTLGLDEKELHRCDECQQIYLKEDMKEIEPETEDDYGRYLCDYCQDAETSEYKSATRYYQEGLKILEDKFKK
jgi:hypothetical protein